MRTPLTYVSLIPLLFALSLVHGCSDTTVENDDEGTGGFSSSTGGGSLGTGGGSGGALSGSGGALGSGGAPTGGSMQSDGGGESGNGGSSSGGMTSGGSTGQSGGATGNGGTAPMGAGGQEADGTGGEGPFGSGGSAGHTLPPITDYSQSGPFPTITETSVGPGAGYTVFRPEPLSTDGFLHAPIVFGPGIGQSVTVHTQMLTNFASHGFIVVGTPVLNGGPGDDGNFQKMQEGLAWILAQNEGSGPYGGKVWIDHAISMGFSVGGTAAVELGGDEAVLTVVSIHGHTASAALHGTMLQTTGTGDTVGLPLQQNTYAMSEVPTFLATLTGASHGYIEQDGGGDERPAILAWMRYFIYNDQGAEHYFFGNDCELCKAPWENPQRKNWD